MDLDPNKAIITYSTVGFGDFSPQSHLGRLVASLWKFGQGLSFEAMTKLSFSHDVPPVEPGGKTNALRISAAALR